MNWQNDIFRDNQIFALVELSVVHLQNTSDYRDRLWRTHQGIVDSIEYRQGKIVEKSMIPLLVPPHHRARML